MTDKTQPLWIRAIVVLNALVFLDFGAAFLLFPEALARFFDIELNGASALADVRAMYGGLSLATGVFFVLGLRRASWFAPSLFLVMATSGGLAAGRVLSILLSGVPSNLVLGLLATEVLSFAWAMLAYRALRSSVGTGAAELAGSVRAM